MYRLYLIMNIDKSKIDVEILFSNPKVRQFIKEHIQYRFEADVPCYIKEGSLIEADQKKSECFLEGIGYGCWYHGKDAPNCGMLGADGGSIYNSPNAVLDEEELLLHLIKYHADELDIDQKLYQE